MIDPAVRDEMFKQLESLPADMQRRVVEFVHALALSQPKGIPGSDLLRFAGTLTPEDAAEMKRAIEEGCERVHPDGW